MVHPMGPVCVEYIPGPSGNHILLEVSQNDLLAALKVELDYTGLIRNSSCMQWNMDVQDK